MTKDRGIPDRRSQRSANPAQRSQGMPEAAYSKRRSRGTATASSRRNASEKSPERNPIVTQSLTRLKTTIDAGWHFAQTQLFKDWRGLIALSLILTGGITIFSVAFLLKLPAVPNCPSVFWPLASASLRMHCAQLAANKRTANDLLEAIKLVNTLQTNHPLYDEAQRLISLWAQDILEIGEEAFQAGKLDDAIATARKVPSNVVAQKEIEARIKRWQTIWSDAEGIYRKAEDALRDQNWRQASTEASRLLSIENTFWQTTKYQELTEKIASTREDINKLAKAKSLIEAGGLKNFQEAIKLASSIGNQSYVYQDAQKAIAQTGQKMLDLAEATLDREDLAGALDILKQIPPVANLQKEVEDFERLANAMAKVWNGMPEDYDAAIADLKKIGSDRPLYSKAQDLIARWQLEKTDVAQLNRARQLAQSGRPEDIQAAIATASQIPATNPRSREARAFLDEITVEIQTREDRPILDRADQLASQGDINSLQAAIDTLDGITPGRALSQEANRKRRQFREQIRELQDQQNALASPSPDPTTSTPIDPALARQEAERSQAQMSLQAARESANLGTVDALAEAIRRADGVGISSPFRREAQQLMDVWSQLILQASISQAGTDVSGAIATAQKIPMGTAAYEQAQLQIQTWRRSLGQ